MNTIEAKHTPGPWKVSSQRHAIKRGEGMRYYVYANVNQRDTRSHDDRFLFNQILSRVDDIELHKEAEANSHIIGVAPEAVEFIADLLDQNAYMLDEVQIQRAEDILKKAYNF